MSHFAQSRRMTSILSQLSWARQAEAFTKAPLSLFILARAQLQERIDVAQVQLKVLADLRRPRARPPPSVPATFASARLTHRVARRVRVATPEGGPPLPALLHFTGPASLLSCYAPPSGNTPRWCRMSCLPRGVPSSRASPRPPCLSQCTSLLRLWGWVIAPGRRAKRARRPPSTTRRRDDGPSPSSTRLSTRSLTSAPPGFVHTRTAMMDKRDVRFRTGVHTTLSLPDEAALLVTSPRANVECPTPQRDAASRVVCPTRLQPW